LAGLVERAKDGVIGVGKGAGDAVESVRSTTTGIVTGALRGAGDVTSAAVAAVGRAVGTVKRGLRSAASLPREVAESAIKDQEKSS
jgi:hypothetical protein